jgi:hypothetical protein
VRLRIRQSLFKKSAGAVTYERNAGTVSGVRTFVISDSAKEISLLLMSVFEKDCSAAYSLTTSNSTSACWLLSLLKPENLISVYDFLIIIHF